MSLASCKAIVLLVIFSFFGEALAQEVYRWMDDRGIVHFADSLHTVPEKYRREAEKRIFAPSSEMSTPTPQGDSKPANEPALRQPGVPFVQQGDKLKVEGFINQRGPVSFVVDRTAKVSSIPISLASRLGVNLGSALPFRMDVGIRALPFWMDPIGITGRVLVRLVAIDSLRLGDLEVTNLEIEINPRESSGVALLGMDFLGQFRVLVDHESQQMVLVREEGPYGGHRPEWWQEKFRIYRELSQAYEKQIKSDKEYILKARSFGLEFEDPDLVLRLSKRIKEYEGYLQIVKEWISVLDLRARRASLPRNFRE